MATERAAAEAALCSAVEKRGTNFHQFTADTPASPPEPPALVGVRFVFLTRWTQPCQCGRGSKARGDSPCLNGVIQVILGAKEGANQSGTVKYRDGARGGGRGRRLPTFRNSY